MCGIDGLHRRPPESASLMGTVSVMWLLGASDLGYLNILMVSNLQEATFLSLSHGCSVSSQQGGPTINKLMASCCFCMSALLGWIGNLFPCRSPLMQLMAENIFPMGYPLVVNVCYVMLRPRDQIITTNITLLCLSRVSPCCVWNWLNLTTSGRGSVRSDRFKIATERESAIDVKAAQKWVFLAFRLKWRGAIVTGSKVVPKQGPIIKHSPTQSLSDSESAPSPPSHSASSMHRICPRFVICPFLGPSGSRHLLSRRLLTRATQLKCLPSVSSFLELEEAPPTPVNIYCPTKIHHSLPSSLWQHA